MKLTPYAESLLRDLLRDLPLAVRMADDALLRKRGWTPGENDGGLLVRHWSRGGFWSERAAVLARLKSR